MRFGSLFSGIGGIDLGLERAGMSCAWQVENDDYASRVLAKHWPDVPRYRDIREVDFAGLEPVELVAGGFPCQPVSLAGRGRAQEDERWLWPEFVRALRVVRPRYILVENVRGLSARGLDKVLGDLWDGGYHAEWQSLTAAAFGAPHLRDRIFVVAYAVRDELWPEQRWGRGPTRQVAPIFRHDGSQKPVAHTDGQPLVGATEPRTERHPWSVEPEVCRVAHGVSRRVDRLRGLGNAVVPQVAEYVGRLIVEHEKATA